jgi:hypothetical protein
MTKDIDQETGHDDWPRSRAEAKKSGSKFYFTGKPCKRGHISLRYTGSGCLECAKEMSREYREENAKALAGYAREWRAANPEKSREYGRKWRAENQEKELERGRSRAKKNVEKERERKREHARKKREQDPDGSREKGRRWRDENPEKQKEYSRKRHSKPKERINSNMRKAVSESINRKKSGRAWEKLVGYSLTQLVEHLEKLFNPGMSWENYGRGGWHIDHIVPLAAHNFDSTADIDFKRAWALSNLQPLWEAENLSKKDNLDEPFQPSLKLLLLDTQATTKEAA